MRFVDTNILLYAISTAPDEQAKAARAREILHDDDLATSVQVLQEFYVQSTRTTRSNPISHGQAVALVEAFARFPIQEITLGVMQAALAAKEKFHISYWDAAIVEAARALGCRQILTEDLNSGQDFGGIQAVNPFLHPSAINPSV
jgi:predicted nucleic acid-binding protein